MIAHVSDVWEGKAKLLGLPQHDLMSRLHLYDVPALFIHGKDDTVVPYSHSQLMYKIYGGKRTICLVAGSHTSTRGRYCMDTIVKFVSQIFELEDVSDMLPGDFNDSGDSILFCKRYIDNSGDTKTDSDSIVFNGNMKSISPLYSFVLLNAKEGVSFVEAFTGIVTNKFTFDMISRFEYLDVKDIIIMESSKNGTDTTVDLFWSEFPEEAVDIYNRERQTNERLRFNSLSKQQLEQNLCGIIAQYIKSSESNDNVVELYSKLCDIMINRLGSEQSREEVVDWIRSIFVKTVYVETGKNIENFDGQLNQACQCNLS